MKQLLQLVLLLMLSLFADAQKENYAIAGRTRFTIDSLPVSEINIPMQVNLKPLYALAEKSVGKVFTSPNYPNDWVKNGCGTRYKYSFRRSALQIKPQGNTVILWFTGYYKIVGSTRACINGTAISPWTPDCRCGFDEPERRVNISFTTSITVLPDYTIKLNIKRNEPVPLDKCEVCFWGQDITSEVLSGLNAELDASKKEIEKSYGLVNLKPPFQQVWDELNKTYNLYNMGWLQINPKRMRIDNIYVKNDSLNIMLGLSASPLVSFDKPVEKSSWIPNITDQNTKSGFSIFLDAQLNYDSLTKILNAQIVGKEFDFNKGLIKKKFIIDRCKLYGENNDQLIIRVDFSGTNDGVIYLSGTPQYDAEKKLLTITDIDFDLKSKNFLLKSADLFFSKKIVQEISNYARYDVSDYVLQATESINTQLNREWMKGIRSRGGITDIKIIGMYPTYRHLLIRSNCSGTMAVEVDKSDLSF